MGGLIDTIKLAGILVFAIPAGLAGLELAMRGNTLVGGALVGLAIMLVVIDHYLTTPGDIPGMVASRVAGKAVRDPEESEE
ncbi:DUF7533 family protein [Natronosalvus caseinilyticus]|uniref:DUF7533 family protein n=1 Tax=Natronosalvus caseinilyticus TaxID=2953747 RepID=UPI0028A93E91|nr:hypothetical protein [Natronosalvus caseinilyticus]